MAGRNSNKSALTREAKTTSPPSFTTDSPYQPRSDFDFPTLTSDGSIPDLIETHPPPGQRTPPAALSSLGVKMAGDTITDTATDDASWEVVENMSEVSNDDNETVSIASDNLASDNESIMTPDDADSVYELEDTPDMPELPNATGLTPSQTEQMMRDELRREREELEDREAANDSFLSEDLETPRQSTINAYNPPPSVSPLNDEARTSALSTAAGEQGVRKGMHGRTKSSKQSSKDPTQPQSSKVPHIALFMVFIVTSIYLQLYQGKYYYYYSSFSLNARREALSDALVKLTNATNATTSFNIEHLLPTPTALPSTDLFGRPRQGTLDVHFQGAHPNHIIISMPRQVLSRTPQIVSTKVYKGDKFIAFNQTRLIDGVYAITLDPHDAHGIVTVNMPCKKPDLNVTVSHNFGRRYLQLPTFEKARITDLSKTVTKDVSLARDRALGLAERVNAGIAATHNVSSLLAQQVSHEAHLFANTAASVVSKWYSASDAQIRKDIMTVQEGFARAETKVDDFVADMAVRVKRSVMQPLSVAQDRAGKIRAKYFGSNAAREKVCKRDQLIKYNSASLLSHPHANDGCVLKHRDVLHKNGELVEKKTCGSCDPLKKFLGPKCLGKSKNTIKPTWENGKDA